MLSMKNIQIYLMVLLGFFISSLCFADAESWYAEHPEALQKVILDCPNRQPKNISCRKLQEIGVRLNSFIYELQNDAQNYGQQILALQNKIVAEKQELAKNPASDAVKLSLQNDNTEVSERLAIVRWLASPKA